MFPVGHPSAGKQRTDDKEIKGEEIDVHPGGYRQSADTGVGCGILRGKLDSGVLQVCGVRGVQQVVGVHH